MSIKQIALSLSKLEKAVSALPENSLQTQLKSHIDAMLSLLLKDRVQENEAKNFTLKPVSSVKKAPPGQAKKKKPPLSEENLAKPNL